jgi:serine protease Do
MQPQIPAQADRIRVLGLTVDELTPAARKLSGLAKGGALVTEVGQGIGAASGLQAGDVIKMFDRKTVTSPQQLRDLVASAEKARSTVAALILRDGDPMFVPMRLHD